MAGPVAAAIARGARSRSTGTTARTFWLSGRYNDEVYAINTTTGHLIARIPVGQGPHGLSVWPQPGRHSLGHTGVLR